MPQAAITIRISDNSQGMHDAHMLWKKIGCARGWLLLNTLDALHTNLCCHAFHAVSLAVSDGNS